MADIKAPRRRANGGRGAGGLLDGEHLELSPSWAELQRGLRLALNVIVVAADHSPSRSRSEQALRLAAADVSDALAAIRREALS